MSYKLKLRELRKAKKLTQGQLGALINETDRVIGSWERGETNMLLEDAYKCAVALGCDVNALCGWNEEGSLGSESGVTDGFENELIRCYRASTPEQKDLIIMSARNAAGMSKERVERYRLSPEQDGGEGIGRTA